MISAKSLLAAAPRRRSLAFATIGALLIVLPGVSACSKNSSSEAPAADASPIIARVNGVDIRERDLALAEEDLGPEVQAASPEAKREHLIGYLTDMMIVARPDGVKLGDRRTCRGDLIVQRRRRGISTARHPFANVPNATLGFLHRRAVAGPSKVSLEP